MCPKVEFRWMHSVNEDDERSEMAKTRSAHQESLVSLADWSQLIA